MIIHTIVKACVTTDSTGATHHIPALLGPNGIVTSVLDYCFEHSATRSIDWMHKVLYACQLFTEYLNAHPDDPGSERIYLNFSKCLLTGTFDVKTGLDPSNLCWMPRTARNANNIIARLNSFFSWLQFKTRGQMSPQRDVWMTPYDQAIKAAAYHHRRNAAFLGHSWSIDAPKQGSVGSLFVGKFKSPKVTRGEPPAFPDERFMDLILDGFKVHGSYDYRNILITLLLNGAGFRTSEPFHLYVSDVVPYPLEPSRAYVRIHHPSESIAPEDWMDASGKRQRSNRRQYLHHVWKFKPRDEISGSGHAGWKGGLLSLVNGEFFYQAHWFVPQMGELFLKFWYLYLAQLTYLERSHPFAFVNLQRGGIGAVYQIGEYQKAHARAVKRIGLVPSKYLGTTPHGHRHAYGRRLFLAGCSGAEIQRYMHHSSPQSQEAYTQATQLELYQGLEDAHRRMSNSIIDRWTNQCGEAIYQLDRNENN